MEDGTSGNSSDSVQHKLPLLGQFISLELIRLSALGDVHGRPLRVYCSILLRYEVSTSDLLDLCGSNQESLNL